MLLCFQPPPGYMEPPPPYPYDRPPRDFVPPMDFPPSGGGSGGQSSSSHSHSRSRRSGEGESSGSKRSSGDVSLLHVRVANTPQSRVHFHRLE